MKSSGKKTRPTISDLSTSPETTNGQQKDRRRSWALGFYGKVKPVGSTHVQLGKKKELRHFTCEWFTQWQWWLRFKVSRRGRLSAFLARTGQGDKLGSN